MSISSEISRISGNISDSLAAVAAKGVTVPSGSNSDDLAGLIAQISGGGGTETIIVPEQTVTANSSATYIQFNQGLTEGESYKVQINGETKSVVCTLTNASYELYFTSLIEVIWIYGDMLFYLDSSSLYGTYTVKVWQESGGGGGSTLIEKTITANGTYDAEDDDADGYSSVTVNVSGGSTKNVQTNQTTDRRNSTSLGSINSLTCSKAGTYDVYWTCARSNTSQTWGSQLYIGGTAYGTENTTWTNNVQTNHLENVSISANATVAVYGRSRSGYYIYAPQLTIVQK